MNTPLRSKVLAITATAFLALPLPMVAATHTQLLNQALRSTEVRPPELITGTVDLTTATHALTKDGVAGSGSLKLHFTVRTTGTVNQPHDQEGRFVVDSFSADAGPLELPMKLTQPIAVAWKQIDKKAYIKLESFPNDLLSFITGTTSDVGLVGQWFDIDMGGSTPTEPLSLLPYANDLKTARTEADALPKVSIVSVTRVEKTEHRADGHAISRLRIRINPAFLWALQNNEIKKIDRSWSAAWRRVEVASINSRYAELRKLLARTSMVVMLDETAGTIERFELGGTTSQPTKACTYNATTRRDVCRVTAVTTIRFAAGLSLQNGTNDPVVTPWPTQSLMDFFAKLDAMRYPQPASDTGMGTSSTDMNLSGTIGN